MIFDSYDVMFLRLCGLCRYLPCDLKNRYEHPLLRGNIADNLYMHGLIKPMPDKKSVKLTRMGKKVLADMGYEYPDEIRQRKHGNTYRRRLISARLNMLLHCVGIDIFTEHIGQLSGKETGYIPSLTMRAANKSKALAGTRFLGILRLADTAYIPYYMDELEKGIFPSYEKSTIDNHIGAMAGVKQIKSILVGESLEALLQILLQNEDKQFEKGLVPHGRALRMMNYNCSLLPLNRCGVLQINIMAQQDYRKRIVRCFSFGENRAKENSFCDGVYEATTAIAAVDMDLTHIQKAIEESAALRKPANLICLGDQLEALKIYLNALPKVNVQKIYTIKKEKIQKIFPEMNILAEEMRPYQTEKGEYVKVNERGKTIFA